MVIITQVSPSAVFGLSPCTGMETVCPLLAVTVSTVGPAGMVVTRLAWPVLAASAVLVLLVLAVTPGSLSGGSTNRRRQNGPLGGELYRSCRVVGEGDTPGGGGADYLTLIQV